MRYYKAWDVKLGEERESTSDFYWFITDPLLDLKIVMSTYRVYVSAERHTKMSKAGEIKEAGLREKKKKSRWIWSDPHELHTVVQRRLPAEQQQEVLLLRQDDAGHL